jgi:integrase
MSVHAFNRPNGTPAFRVRWRENGRNRGRIFDDKQLALDFDAEMRRLRQSGELDIVRRQHTVTVREVAADWWEHHVEPNLTPGVQDNYAALLDQRILPRFGDLRLRQVTPVEIEKWIGELKRRKVGDPTIIRALGVLQGIFARAVRNELVARNPVTAVKKPAQRRTREPVLYTPLEVELIRVQLLARPNGLRHAALVSLLAYSGPRPESEALPLTWGQVRRNGLLYRRTKYAGGRTTERLTELVKPLAEDLAVWRKVAPRSGAAAPVFPAAGGGPMGEHDWDNWRDRIFRPAAAAAGLGDDVRPRDLRGSFASLLVWEGRSIVEVAQQLGHSPQQCMSSYLGVFADFDPARRTSAEDAIRSARSLIYKPMEDPNR